MGLFDFLKKKEPQKIKVEIVGYENGKNVELQQSEEDFDTSDLEHQMSIQLTLNSEITPLENDMVGFVAALKQKQKIDDEIVILESLIEYYEDIKQRCYALGPDYIEYFTKTWAEARAGKEDGPDYITQYKKRLTYLRENYNKLLEQERLHEEESKNLEDRILAILKASESILQTDIYKQFHSTVKPDIQSILYFMEKEGRIRREKTGRTYIVHFIK